MDNIRGGKPISRRKEYVVLLVDTHLHLDMEPFDQDRQQVLERALECGIGYMITIGIDMTSSLKALQLTRQYDFVYSTIGYHPHHATDMDTQTLNELSRLVSEPKIVAWGEIGLDFFHRHSPPEIQREVFRQQLEMAIDFDLPVIIHVRDAHEEILDILIKTGKGRHKGVIHCFSGDYALAMVLIDMGYYISIPGIVTYKNAFQIQDVAARIPLENMLLETDAPYLAPVPKRGKRNEPSFVTYTAKKVAQLRGITVQEVCRQTTDNAKTLFGLPDSL
jgi:TatD DNase family protein